MKADRLRDALSEVGLQVNSTILGAVMHRYIRKDGTLRFGDFVAILLNLSIAFGKNITIYFLNIISRKVRMDNSIGQ